ncbi:MAG: response regulator [Myxococcales bacterium]|nr:response regulator [Myxococcales bacterium]
MTKRNPWTGQEVLIVDQDERVLRGLEKLFRDIDMLVTGLSDVERAKDQLSNKFFPVALIDLDTPGPDKGLELLAFAKEKSPVTNLIVMSGRRTFEAASTAFRAGALDVVPKSQDAVLYLRDRVIRACQEIEAKTDTQRLLTQLGEVHEDFLREMMDLSRRLVDLEDRLLSREQGSSPSMHEIGNIPVLLVDDDASLFGALERLLPAEKGWRIRIAQSGGEALDAASQAPPRIAVIKESLPDLPSSMVVKTIRNASPEVMVLLFTPPAGATVGEVKVVESSRLITLVPSFTDPTQLASSLEEVREAIKQKGKERRYLKVFRRDHLEFINRYNRLRTRLQTQLGKKDE